MTDTTLHLYLDLTKKVLTNTLFETEPQEEGDSEKSRLMSAGRFLAHYMDSNAISMLPLARLDNLERCIFDVVKNGVPGDVIETGVWRGGATIFMRAVLKALDVTDRVVWVADSFEGLPKPDEDLFPAEHTSYHSPVISKGYANFACDLKTVKRNFEAFGLLDAQVRFLKGWFRDTLPNAPIERLSVLRLDGDYYESTMDSLTHLYSKLSIGGFAIIDDYGEDTWTYCRRAVDEFRASHGISEPLEAIDSKCVCWRRER
jgi:Macrocin-O-methyltransferase (TylF)